MAGRQRKSSYSGKAKEAPDKPEPLTEKQGALLKAIEERDQVITLGPAGTGKPFIPAAMAAYYYGRRDIDKVIVTRPNVSSGKSLGYFPGTLEEKMMPWVMPVREVLEWRLSICVIETGI